MFGINALLQNCTIQRERDYNKRRKTQTMKNQNKKKWHKQNQSATNYHCW